MTRKEFEARVLDIYGVRADYPFSEDFVSGVFRHGDGRWFALAMRIGADKLGLSRPGQVDIVNFKCAPEVIDSIAGVEPGIYRAYHMNKSHWLTVMLSECDEETVLWLLGISYELTRKKIKRK